MSRVRSKNAEYKSNEPEYAVGVANKLRSHAFNGWATMKASMECLISMGRSKADRSTDRQLAMEEMLADAYAGINAFGAGATKFSEAVQGFMRDNHMSRETTQDNGTEQPTGPPSQSRTFQQGIEAQMRGEPAGQKENTAGSGGERYSVDNLSVDELVDAEYDRLARDLELRGDPRKMPRNSREWHTFNRSFANKTSGIKKGVERKIIICTHRNAYIVTADGYMRGYAEEKVRISNRNLPLLNALRRYLYGIDEYRETVSEWLDAVEHQQGDDRRNLFDVGNGKAEGRNAGLYVPLHEENGRGVAYGTRSSDGSVEDPWGYEVDEYPNGALIYDGKGGAFRVNEYGGFEPLDLEGEVATDIKQQIQAVLDKVSPNHAEQMQRYTELKNSDSEAAQRVHDELMSRT